MAGPPSTGTWATTNSLGTDMLAWRGGSEVRAVYVTGGNNLFQIYLAAYDCYSGCSQGSATNFTSGYQIAVYGSSIVLYSTWVNPLNSNVQYYTLTSTTISALQTGSVIRALARDDPAGGVDVILYVNNSLAMFYHDTNSLAISGGSVGFNFAWGAANTYVSEGDVGPLDTTAPNAVPSANFTSSAFTNHVDLQWTAATDNTNGIGVYGYQILRNGTLLTSTPITTLSYSDLTVSPSSTYTYTVRVVDYHWNHTDTSITVNTPFIATHGPYPSATPDGFRTGVKPTGAYWGAGNENIDVMSGNLSFSLPLLNAKARTSWSVPFKLSYNSQNWRQDSGGAWALGGDTGVGFGWRLMAGSITPVVSGSTVSFYIFTDATGAEYRLDQNSGNIWSSKESIYVYFDASADVLHFRDGSFWTMACVSAASEADSGVMYPTVMEDTNGNQIQIAYKIGSGATWTNSSSRISTIQDVRGSSSTFTFNYNTDYPVPHLTSITNSISTGEQYTFSYAINQPIVSPINGQHFGETAFLASSTVTGVGVVTSFSYDGSGELTQAVLPYGGYVKWDYDTVAYSSGISYREVQHRYLSKDGTTGSQTTYALSHESSVTTPIHQYTIIDDPGGVGEKYWAFGTSGISMGLVTQYQGRQRPGPVNKTQNDFTWSQDSVGNSYISTTLNTLDSGQTYQAQSKTTQTVDIYGNVTQVNTFNYGNLSTPARTNNYTYLNSSAYTSRYIFNRLSTASVTDGTNTKQLASITYDGSFSTVTNPSSNWDTGYSSVTTRGNVLQSTTTNNVTSYTYNQLGVVTGVTSNGVATSVTTSNSNSYAAPSQISVGGLTTSLSWTSFLGLSNDTGPNGDSASVYFDSYARQTSTTSPFGATTTYTYSSAPYTSSNQATVTATTNGRWTKTFLDGLGRTVMTQTGNGTTVVSQTETVYDSCACSPTGKMTQQSLPHAPGATPVWTTYTYDGIGRTLQKQTVGTGTTSTTTYAYWSNDVQVLDATQKWKTFQMDVFGNLSLVAEPDPANPTTAYYYTYYTYDLLNNLTQVSMPRPTGTQTRTFVYNGKLLTSATNPENGTVTYTYNSYNKVATKTDAKGQAIVYTYDSLARLTKVQRYPSGTSGSEDICQQENYYYDSNPFTSSYSQYSSGRLAAVQYYAPPASAYVANYNCGTTLVEQYSYNQGGAKTNKGMLVTRTLAWQSDSAGSNPPTITGASTADLESSYTYDNEGRMTGIQYPGGWNGTSTIAGPSVGYTYDSMGRLGGITSPSPNYSATYNAANQLLTLGVGTGFLGFNETRQYNSLGQLTNITAGSNNGAGFQAQLNITYNFSSTQNNGKITSQTDGISGEQVVYAYDSLNRLASAGATNNSWGQSYAYDGFGNLTTQTVTAGTAPALSVTYNAATNRQSGESADANGNINSGGYSGYGYDVENRIVSVPGGTQYAYAPGNKRVWRGTTVNDPVTNTNHLSVDEITFWSITGQKLATYPVSGDPNLVYSWAQSGGAPTPAVTATLGTPNYYFGSRLLTSVNGSLYPDRLGSFGKYYPWGQEKPSATTNGTEKFTGYFRDSETGLDYADQRYYQPGMGRFTTPDRYIASGGLSNPGSWSRYAYVSGDPINFVDPSGEYEQNVCYNYSTAYPTYCSPAYSLLPTYTPPSPTNPTPTVTTGSGGSTPCYNDCLLRLALMCIDAAYTIKRQEMDQYIAAHPFPGLTKLILQSLTSTGIGGFFGQFTKEARMTPVGAWIGFLSSVLTGGPEYAQMLSDWKAGLDAAIAPGLALEVQCTQKYPYQPPNMSFPN